MNIWNVAQENGFGIFKAWNNNKKPANELKILQILHDEVMNFTLAQLLARTIRNVASSD